MLIQGNLNAVRDRDEIVTPRIEPFVHAHGPGVILQQDNAPSHRAHVVQQHMQARQIDVLPWPANSPDMSPIEHVWDELQRRLQRRPRPPLTLQELRQALQEEWQAMPQAFFGRLVCSM